MKAIIPGAILALFIATDALAVCGCEATSGPCEEETLASAVAAQQLSQGYDMSLTADAGTDWGGVLVLCFLLATAIFLVKKIETRRNGLVLLTLPRESKRAEWDAELTTLDRAA